MTDPIAKPTRRFARQPKSQESQTASPEEASAASPVAAPELKSPTKAATILNLLRRSEGATLEQLVSATGWLPHTTRAALTRIKCKGHALSSEKIDGVRTYRVAAEQPWA
jgi:hypothetical protein